MENAAGCGRSVYSDRSQPAATTRSGESNNSRHWSIAFRAPRGGWRFGRAEYVPTATPALLGIPSDRAQMRPYAPAATSVATVAATALEKADYSMTGECVVLAT